MQTIFRLFGSLFPLVREIKKRKTSRKRKFKHDFSLFEDDRFVPKKWFRTLGQVNT